MNPFSLIVLIFDEAFLRPTINLLVLLNQLFSSIGLPGAFGFAIIILTVLIRILIWPFMSSQLKSAMKMAEMKPHLDALKAKHKGDKQALASAQMALYKEHGINPAGGCLPTLIQIPVLIALYQAVYAFFSGQEGLDNINKLLYNESWHLDKLPNLDFLGVNLASKPSDFGSVGVFILLIPIITALLQFAQSKMMIPKAVKQYPSDSPKEKKEKESTEDTMAAVQSQMMYLMPIMIGYFAFQFPVALALYWNTITLLGIYQQYLLSGWGGLEDFLSSLTNRLKTK